MMHATLFFAAVVLAGLAWLVVVDIRRQRAHDKLETDLVIANAALQQSQATVKDLQAELALQRRRLCEVLNSEIVDDVAGLTTTDVPDTTTEGDNA